jgi:hypothetical protein
MRVSFGIFREKFQIFFEKYKKIGLDFSINQALYVYNIAQLSNQKSILICVNFVRNLALGSSGCVPTRRWIFRTT